MFIFTPAAYIVGYILGIILFPLLTLGGLLYILSLPIQAILSLFS